MRVALLIAFLIGTVAAGVLFTAGPGALLVIGATVLIVLFILKAGRIL
jgi:hypothetical protein